jgi:hypothetical protein
MAHHYIQIVIVVSRHLVIICHTFVVIMTIIGRHWCIDLVSVGRAFALPVLTGNIERSGVS